MSFRVGRPGLLTTIQDRGRKGVGKYGLSMGGGMDPYALRIANLLLNNPGEAPVLEITLIGPELTAEEDHWISLCGGNLSPVLDGKPIPHWQPVLVRKGQTLRFGPCIMGCRAYLAVRGGFAVPLVLGGAGTDLRGKFGGFSGRPLQKGDKLFVKCQKGKPVRSFFLGKDYLPAFSKQTSIRVIVGPEYDTFTPEAQSIFFSEPYQITLRSDRMGYRLEGPLLHRKIQEDILSSSVSWGTIQVPPAGNPIILMADSQTIGGYPRIGVVATVDLPVLGQCKPGDVLTFQEIPLEEAQGLYRKQEDNFRCLQQWTKSLWEV